MASLPPDVLGPLLSTAGWQRIGAKYGATATLFLFAYDHLLTLPEEIEYIWKRKFTAVTYLFFINRYYALCIFTVALMTLVLPDYTSSDCHRAAFLVPFLTRIPMMIVPDMVIGIRVYALYGRNKALGLFLTLYIIAEIGIALWLYSAPSLHVTMLPGPPDANSVPVLHDCLTNVSKHLTSGQSATYQAMQCGYDTAAFLLIAYKTFYEAFGNTYRCDKRGFKFLMAKDGMLYYAVAFLCNFTWVLMIVFAPDGLKAAPSQPTVQLVCLSVNRLTLSLRSYRPPGPMQQDGYDNDAYSRGSSTLRDRRLRRRGSWVGTSTFEIGEDFVPKSLDYADDFLVFTSEDNTRTGSDELLNPTQPTLCSSY